MALSVQMLIGIVAAVVLLMSIIWLVPRWQVSRLQTTDEVVRFEKENEARATVSQIIGGMAIVLTFAGLILTEKDSQEKSRLDEEKLLTDRFTKAVSQVASKEAGPRVGGMFALERLASESERLHWPVMETLAAFVRDQAAYDGHGDHYCNDSHKLRQDVEIAMQIVGRRNVKFDPAGKQMDLRSVNLDHAQLDHADFHDALFDDLSFCGTNLENAQLSGARLASVRMVGVSLNDACLAGAWLGGANLHGARLKGTRFIRSYVEDMDLENSFLEKAYFQDLRADEEVGREMFDNANDWRQATFIGPLGQRIGVPSNAEASSRPNCP